MVKEELSKKKAVNGYLTTSFFSNLLDEFELTESCADQLEEPEDDEEVNDLLLEALSYLHHKNPAARTSGPFERFMETCPVLNRRSLYGAITGTQVSLTVACLWLDMVRQFS